MPMRTRTLTPFCQASEIRDHTKAELIKDLFSMILDLFVMLSGYTSSETISIYQLGDSEMCTDQEELKV